MLRSALQRILHDFSALKMQLADKSHFPLLLLIGMTLGINTSSFYSKLIKLK